MCYSRKIEPITCPLNFILNFLSDIYGKGLKYRTIGVHRSAISAYHIPVEGIAVGKHPKVCSLMMGVANIRPPCPKYGFTWDVESVLRFLKNWPCNAELSPKFLSWKLAILLSLTAISRSSELHLLDLRFLSQFSSCCSFEIFGTTKTSKGGKKPKPIEFYSFPDDPQLCPVEVIKSYISMTKEWRVGNNGRSSLFISHISPHDPIGTSSIARWIKDLLDLSGVDISVFQAHSVRGAASSKALMKGLSVKEILNKGNWSRESTWQKFYNREIVSPTQIFQQKVLKL